MPVDTYFLVVDSHSAPSGHSCRNFDEENMNYSYLFQIARCQEALLHTANGDERQHLFTAIRVYEHLIACEYKHNVHTLDVRPLCKNDVLGKD